MKLSDVMGNAGLSVFAEIAMIVFLVAFVAIVVRLFWPSRQARLERQRFIPLEDEPLELRKEARR